MVALGTWLDDHPAVWGMGAVFGMLLIVGLFVAGVHRAIEMSLDHNIGLLPKPAYYDGEMVRMVATGHEGMVVSNWCRRRGCTYSVRFDALQLRTDVVLLGRDGPITFSPVALVSGIREFEIEAVQ